VAPLTAAEAWCWVAYLHSQEDSFHTYRYPRTEEDEAAAHLAQQQGDAAFARAVKLDSSDDLWQRSLAKWDRP